MPTLPDLRWPRPEPEPHCTASSHGTAGAYTASGCRCSTARAAHARAKSIDRSATLTRPPAWLPPQPTRRRLRALAHLGYRTRALAESLGWSDKDVRDTRAGCRRPGSRIHRDRAHQVERLYTLLVRVPPIDPDPATIDLAHTRGWVPPWAWDDIIRIDDPADLDQVAAATAGQHPVVRRRALAERRAQLAEQAQAEARLEARRARQRDRVRELRAARAEGLAFSPAGGEFSPSPGRFRAS